MRKIYKYELPVDGNIITIKQCIIKILSIQEQNGIPVMWAIVDPEVEVINPMEIIAIGTGWEIPTGIREYLGTAQDKYGYVWHYFSLQLENLEKLAVLADAFGKIGISAEQAAQAFDMRGLFDACM